MKVHTLLANGKYHPVYCEDNLFNHLIGNRWLIGAVMDGCSSGIDSHFASALFAKLLAKSSARVSDQLKLAADQHFDQITGPMISRFLLKQAFIDLAEVKKSLELEASELLSTLILLVLDTVERMAWVCVSGDGYVACNGVIHEIDQDNIPDYMAYHFELSCDDWFRNHTNIYTFTRVEDISVSTDGVGKIIKNPNYDSGMIDPIEYLLLEKPRGNDQNQLQYILNVLINERHHILFDDVAIIRVIF